MPGSPGEVYFRGGGGGGIRFLVSPHARTRHYFSSAPERLHILVPSIWSEKRFIGINPVGEESNTPDLGYNKSMCFRTNCTLQFAVGAHPLGFLFLHAPTRMEYYSTQHAPSNLMVEWCGDKAPIFDTARGTTAQ